MSEHLKRNRLARESSPYLLQHAGNPVDWWPWGAEAFEQARRRDVPIFLSIGYSTCYWCHVMERESFEDAAVARLLNERFVCIKVDREERPDVDDLYMNAVQVLTGHGGWPMSVFLEPQGLRPFYAGTYFPPEPRYGMPSFVQVIEGISNAWRSKREEALQQADELAGAVRENLQAAAAPRAVGAEQVGEAVSTLLRLHDRVHGGFGAGGADSSGKGPKFPQPSYVDFLLDFRAHAADEQVKAAVDAAVRLTLDRMALGGMFDQVGGGFHRYSVDGRWIVPHFEKMLYDNGQLAETYARAAAIYGDAYYREVAVRTCDYMLREMTPGGEVAGGAMASAQDAEVDGHEGQNYVWTREQLSVVLEKQDADFAARVYGLEAGPNFRDPHHPEDAPVNVLFLAARPERIAEDLGLSLEAFRSRIVAINAKLFQARTARKQPRLDDKVLASWNGLAIAGLATAGALLNEPRLIDGAARAADAVQRLLCPGGRVSAGLMRAWRGESGGAKGASSEAARVPAFLEDYAMLARGLLALCRAGHPRAGEYLAAARELESQAARLFVDPVTGQYCDTRENQPDLFVRARSTYDGAMPSGVSVMLHVLLDLHELTGETLYVPRAAVALASVSAALSASPVATINSTRALLRMLTSRPAAEAIASAMAPFEAPAAVSYRPGAGDIVEILSPVERISVGQGPEGVAGTVLRVRVPAGYHVNAADLGAIGQTDVGRSLVPFRVFIVGGSGYSAYADYPKGSTADQADGPLVYQGEFDLPVVIEQVGEITGRPLLAVRYQACTSTECLAPVTVELDIAIDRR